MPFYRAVLAIAFLIACSSSRVAAQSTDPSCFGPDIKEGVLCPGEGVDPLRATTAPSAHAWALFAEVNQPAFPGNATDTRRVWETWKNADDNRDASEAIYLNNGHVPRVWNVSPKSAPLAKQFVPNQQLLTLRQKLDVLKRPSVLFVPLAPQGQETRTNRPGFNFILANQLYNKQGQFKFASQFRLSGGLEGGQSRVGRAGR
jgi:hypothetical protein